VQCKKRIALDSLRCASVGGVRRASTTMNLYKYMERRWANKFLKEGTLLIGTLYDFQDEEQHGGEIGDALEGTKQVSSMRLKMIDTDEPENIPYWMSEHMNVSGSNRLVIHARDGMSAVHKDPNAYIFCCTDTFDAKAMKEMAYDCCIEILDADIFFKATSIKMKHYAKFWGAAKCVYKATEIEHSEDEIPATFIKEPKFAAQKEVRGLWLPKEPQSIKPIVLKSKKAARACRIYA
jgi:hypothetical protein